MRELLMIGRLPESWIPSDRLLELELSDVAREQVTVGLAMIDAFDAQSAPITRQLRLYARRQPGCRALMGHDREQSR